MTLIAGYNCETFRAKPRNDRPRPRNDEREGENVRTPKESPEHTAFRERLGLIMDTCDNGLAALQMPLPDSIHKEGLKGVIEEIKRIAQYGNP